MTSQDAEVFFKRFLLVFVDYLIYFFSLPFFGLTRYIIILLPRDIYP